MRTALAAQRVGVSGGAYDRAYVGVESMADDMRRNTNANTVDADSLADRLWFAGLLRLVGRAMHDVEWVDSDDYGPGDEIAAIRAVRDYAANEIEIVEPDEDDAPPQDSAPEGAPR